MSEKIESMLVPVSEDEPAGENMEYDPLFVSLESISVGTPEQQMGDSVSEGVAPDWRELEQTCDSLWEKTRDLRVAVYFAQAWSNTRGVEGFLDGLELIYGLFSEFWDNFYPQLDPDDDNDPLERMNTLSWISPPPGAYEDPFDFPGTLRKTLICSTPMTGKVYLRDLLIINGDLQLSDDSERPDPALVNAVFMDVGVEEIGKIAQTITACYEKFKQIDKISSDLAGVNSSIDLEVTSKLLKSASRIMNKQYGEMGGDAPEDEEDEAGDSASSTAAKSMTGEILNRTDVKSALGKIIRYFQLNEPSSPIPFMLKRAQDMLEMDFYELAKELTPESLERVSLIIGQQEGDERD